MYVHANRSHPPPVKPPPTHSSSLRWALSCHVSPHLSWLLSSNFFFSSRFVPPTGDGFPSLFLLSSRRERCGLKAWVSVRESPTRAKTIPEQRAQSTPRIRGEGACTLVVISVSARGCGGSHPRESVCVHEDRLLPQQLRTVFPHTTDEKPLPSSPRSQQTGIEDLRDKREEINKQISKEEDEKAKVQNDLTVLSKRLTTLNDSIARKVRRLANDVRGKPVPRVCFSSVFPHFGKIGASSQSDAFATAPSTRVVSSFCAVPHPRLPRELITTRPFKRLRRHISRFWRVRRRCSPC